MSPQSICLKTPPLSDRMAILPWLPSVTQQPASAGQEKAWSQIPFVIPSFQWVKISIGPLETWLNEKFKDIQDWDTSTIYFLRSQHLPCCFSLSASFANVSVAMTPNPILLTHYTISGFSHETVKLCSHLWKVDRFVALEEGYVTSRARLRGGCFYPAISKDLTLRTQQQFCEQEQSGSCGGITWRSHMESLDGSPGKALAKGQQ